MTKTPKGITPHTCLTLGPARLVNFDCRACCMVAAANAQRALPRSLKAAGKAERREG